MCIVENSFTTEKRQAFIVAGPESSGTKLTARILIESGCWGDYGYEQRLDKYFTGEVTPIDDIIDGAKQIVFRQSVPHGYVWPSLFGLQCMLDNINFDSFFIIVIRNWFANARSKTKNDQSLSEFNADTQILDEWRAVGGQLVALRKFCFLLTSEMFLCPSHALQSLSYYTGLRISESIYNSIEKVDDKYFRNS